MMSSMDLTFNPFQFKIQRVDDEDEDENKSNRQSSSWLIAPYFMIYFLTYIINFLAWPLLIMERLCVNAHGVKQESLFSIKFNMSGYSCVDRFMTGKSNHSNKQLVDSINNDTLHLMIVGAIASAFLSLLFYFIVLKPTLNNCKAVAVFLPPVCILCQCFLFSYALTIDNTTVFKYVMLAGVVVPSVHCNFQGVFLLYFHLTANPERYNFKQKRDIVNTKIDLTHCLIFLAIILGGFSIGVCFDMSYSLIFVIQFTLAFVNALYAVIIAPVTFKCFEKKDEVDSSKKDHREEDDCSSEEEGYLLAKNARKSKDSGLLSNQGNLFSEAPMIFSETAYRKELIVIAELSIFTIAVIADANLSGPYLLQPPYRLTLREYGYCIAAQGAAKTIGLLLMKIICYFSPLKHSTLIGLAAFNYILYYIVLAVIPSKELVYVSLLINFFGGIAIPTLISFMRINFTETIYTVLEISTISSLIVTVGFSSIEYYVYMKTRNLYEGTIFLMTSAIIVLGFVIVLATFFSTTVRNRRRTKDYADKLLNDYQ